MENPNALVRVVCLFSDCLFLALISIRTCVIYRYEFRGAGHPKIHKMAQALPVSYISRLSNSSRKGMPLCFKCKCPLLPKTRHAEGALLSAPKRLRTQTRNQVNEGTQRLDYLEPLMWMESCRIYQAEETNPLSRVRDSGGLLLSHKREHKRIQT